MRSYWRVLVCVHLGVKQSHEPLMDAMSHRCIMVCTCRWSLLYLVVMSCILMSGWGFLKCETLEMVIMHSYFLDLLHTLYDNVISYCVLAYVVYRFDIIIYDWWAGLKMKMIVNMISCEPCHGIFDTDAHYGL